MHRIFKKLRRYFPDPLGIRESFPEIATRHNRVTFDLVSMTFVTYCGAERAKRDRATECGRFLSCVKKKKKKKKKKKQKKKNRLYCLSCIIWFNDP